MKNVNQISLIVAAPNLTMRIADFRYRTFNITHKYPDANISNLLTGHFKLTEYTKSNNFINLLK